jgi:hypothetical protein
LLRAACVLSLITSSHSGYSHSGCGERLKSVESSSDPVCKGDCGMTSIFHYTTPAGLLGILSSGSLFATDYRFLNDASEGAIIGSSSCLRLKRRPRLSQPRFLQKGSRKISTRIMGKPSIASRPNSYTAYS